jgi:NAD(P)-dependent dehydrogenase (short-subunit alcohol dehydrogenase family)
MTDPVILVSGASRGLGAATAQIATGLGARVALMARSAGDLEAVAQQIEANGGQALVTAGDVRQAADCRRAVEATMERFGRLDAVINNAGILEPMAPIAEADPKAWENNWAVNVLGPFLLTQAALPHLRERQGQVLNVSSGAAVSVVEGWAAYCAAKAAVDHFTRVLAAEEPEITAVAFRPGVVDTKMQAQIRTEGASGMPPEVHERFLHYHSEGELLPPQLPGCSLAVLALYAPHDWSGAAVRWNEERVLSLVRQYAAAPCAGDQEENRA